MLTTRLLPHLPRKVYAAPAAIQLIINRGTGFSAKMKTHWQVLFIIEELTDLGRGRAERIWIRITERGGVLCDGNHVSAQQNTGRKFVLRQKRSQRRINPIIGVNTFLSSRVAARRWFGQPPKKREADKYPQRWNLYR